MPRRREFRPDDLLDGALRLFWEKGYEATSIRDIVERTGVNQFGIYQLYGDKQGLFLAVLDRYRDTIVEAVFGIVERPGASVAEIRAYFGSLVRHHSVTMPALGCLMASAMAEHAAADAGIRERVGRHFERLRCGFIRALETARRRGEVRADLDIPTAAEYLAVSVQGLAVYSRLNPDAATLQRYVDTALSLVAPPPAPTAPSTLDLQVLIRVRAFGINRAETYMRRGEWPEIAPVSGIECVGVVEHDPAHRLATGQKVAAIMGGMGRIRNGSYAEFVAVPASNVVPIQTDLGWADFAAIPESYATAWSCLVGNLHLGDGAVLLVRGGTSALGQAAINIAAHAGATVLATTRRESNRALLTSLGAAQVLIETGQLGEAVRTDYPDGIDGVLDLVGNATLLDSLTMVRRGGRVCLAGFLGGGEPLAFNPLLQMPSGVDLSFFGSFMLGTPAFPVTEIPLQEIVDRVASGAYQAKPAKVFPFELLPEAHRLMEANGAGGKIVVVH